MSDSPSPRPHWVRYLAPNGATLGSVIIAWVALTRCLMGENLNAAWIGLWAIFTDRLDGLLARTLKAQSAFGVQLDSLADLVAFGVVPAVISFNFFSQAGFGWGPWPLGAACGAYVACAAIRLARFNVAAEEGPKNEYLGFPTTMTAGFLLTFILSIPHFAPSLDHGWVSVQRVVFGKGEAFLPWCPLAIITGAIGMVAPVRVPRLDKPKQLVLGVGLALVVVGAIVLMAIRRLPEYGLFCITAWFVISVLHHLRTPRAV